MEKNTWTKEEMNWYFDLIGRLVRADVNLSEYENILANLSSEDLNLAQAMAQDFEDWVHCAMISYYKDGFEGFLEVFRKADHWSGLDIFLASLAKVEVEDNFEEIFPHYLATFFDHVMDLINESKSSKAYRRIVEEFSVVQDYPGLGPFIYRSLLENALMNFPNRPALQREVNKALEEMKKNQEPLQTLLEEAQNGNKDHFYNSICDWLLKGSLYLTKQLPKIKGRKYSPLSQVGLLYTKDNEIFIPIFTKKENVLETFSEEMGYYVEEVNPRDLFLEYEQKGFIDYPMVINPFNQAILINDEIYQVLIDKIQKEPGKLDVKASNIIDIRPYLRNDS